jgi:hypothetical protein
LLTSSIIFALSTTAFAYEPFSGPYAGIGAGYADLTSEVDVSDGKNTGLDLNRQAIKGQIFLGYGEVFAERFYLALEANFLTGTPEASGQFSDKFFTKQKYSYGVDLMPGIVFGDNNVIFAKVGYLRSRFDTTFTQEGDNINNATPNNNVNGYRLGLGAEMAISKTPLRLRVEGYHDQYKSYDFNFTPHNDQTFSAKNSLNNVMLSVIYQFM